MPKRNIKSLQEGDKVRVKRTFDAQSQVLCTREDGSYYRTHPTVQVTVDMIGIVGSAHVPKVYDQSKYDKKWCAEFLCVDYSKDLFPFAEHDIRIRPDYNEVDFAE